MPATFASATGHRSFCAGRSARSTQFLLDRSLHRECDAVAAPETQGGDSATEASSLQRVEQRRQHTSAAGANGVSERDGAAIHVHRGRIEAKLAQHRNGLYCERLIEFNEVHVLESPSDL